MTTVNPPPLKIPDQLAQDQETRAFFRSLLEFNRLMWIRTGNDPSGSGAMPIADGGTGATNAADARDNLGLEIGSDVQGWDDDLDDLAALSHALNSFILSNGSDWVRKTLSQTKAILGIDSNGTPTFSFVTVTNDLDIQGQITTEDIIVNGSLKVGGDPYTLFNRRYGLVVG